MHKKIHSDSRSASQPVPRWFTKCGQNAVLTYDSPSTKHPCYFWPLHKYFYVLSLAINCVLVVVGGAVVQICSY